MSFARNFNGTDQYGQSHVALNYSTYQQIALSFWVRMAAYANTDRFVLNMAQDYTTVQGGFYVEVDSPSAGNCFLFGKATGGQDSKIFPRPSAAAWHHYVLHFWPAQASGSVWPNDAYVDGVAATLSGSPSQIGGNCANDFLAVMGRAGVGTLLCPGDICQLAIWGDTAPSGPILSAANVTSLFTGNDATPLGLSLGSGTATLLDYWKLSGTGTSEPNSVGSRPAMDLFGATAPAQTDGPVQGSRVASRGILTGGALTAGGIRTGGML